jgi:hypothetical protein
MALVLVLQKKNRFPTCRIYLPRPLSVVDTERGAMPQIPALSDLLANYPRAGQSALLPLPPIFVPGQRVTVVSGPHKDKNGIVIEPAEAMALCRLNRISLPLAQVDGNRWIWVALSTMGILVPEIVEAVCVRLWQ